MYHPFRWPSSQLPANGKVDTLVTAVDDPASAEGDAETGSSGGAPAGVEGTYESRGYPDVDGVVLVGCVHRDNLVDSVLG